MKWIPYYKTTFELTESRDEVVRRLSEFVEPKIRRGLFGYRTAPTKPYMGRLDISGFEIRRTIYYQNSFLPLILGVFDEQDNLIVTFRMNWVVYFQVGFFLLFSLLIGAALAIGIWIDNHEIWGPLVPIGFCGFGFGLTAFGFNKELSKSLEDFSSLFRLSEMRANGS